MCSEISPKPSAWRGLGEPTWIAVLIGLFLVVFCFSLAEVALDASPIYAIGFDRRQLWSAAFAVAAIGCCVPIFALARFGFGYLVGFYVFALTAGYLWLSFFTSLAYDHVVARWSAAFSLLAFLLSAMWPIEDHRTHWWRLTQSQMDRLATAMVFGCAAVAAIGASYDFHIIGFIGGEALRATLSHPRSLDYAIPISVTAVIPFCYAWFLFRGRFGVAVLLLLIAIAFYPIALSKTTLLVPAWLVLLTALVKLTNARMAVVLSLLVPVLFGLLAIDFGFPGHTIFRVINFRMLAIPSSGLDHYYHYFSSHPLTHFCQISIVGTLFDCSRPDQLGVTMAREYAIGNYNASFLATEGIASVGPYLAPIIAFLCGLIIAAANFASSGLPPKFVLLSGSMMAQILLNVPLSTTLLTYGGVVSFLLWFISPREIQSVVEFRKPR